MLSHVSQRIARLLCDDERKAFVQCIQILTAMVPPLSTFTAGLIRSLLFLKGTFIYSFICTDTNASFKITKINTEAAILYKMSDNTFEF